MRIIVYFTGRPGDENDIKCTEIADRHKAKDIGGGTFLPLMERDREFLIKPENINAFKQDILTAGIRLESLIWKKIKKDQ